MKDLAEQIDEIISTYIVCPDRGILSSSYREEAITQFLALIKREKRKVVEDFAEELKKVSMYCIDGMSITKEENEQRYDNRWKCPNLDEFIDQILNKSKAADNKEEK